MRRRVSRILAAVAVKMPISPATALSSTQHSWVRRFTIHQVAVTTDMLRKRATHMFSFRNCCATEPTSYPPVVIRVYSATVMKSPNTYRYDSWEPWRAMSRLSDTMPSTNEMAKTRRLRSKTSV
ncbi:MAG: hypothetical protein BWX80_02272 [Candidatus Hydrogenedentes bacterium ADurb.Bin101]|nr:MAG: hypothetical protein BWX80_02272 [Candidatus Hydrogenedentes bacterium ADurb.Bin101]